ncbi:hypothetical protein O988_04578 [Pseudogymnoascus sp. VKM F-3808]|nr:hypothetical protein O988_04578 [Pseudogymnoascus sp. VKM F-3808]
MKLILEIPYADYSLPRPGTLHTLVGLYVLLATCHIRSTLAIAAGLVGASHLVAATSKKVLAFGLQRAGATFLLAGSLIGWSLLFQAMKPNTLQGMRNGHVEGRPNAVAKEYHHTVMRSEYKLISLEEARKERLRMFR